MKKLLYSHLELLKLKHVLGSINNVDDAWIENDFIMDLIKDPILRERCEEQRYLTDDSPAAFKPLIDLLVQEFVHHIDKPFFKELPGIPNDVSPFIDAIITNPDTFKGGLSQDEIESLMLLSSDRHYINKWLGEFEISEDVKKALEDNIESTAQHQKDGVYEMLAYSEATDFLDTLNMEIMDEEVKSVGQVGQNEELAFTDYLSLSYTGREKRAIEVYGGVPDGRDALSSMETAYDTLNMLLFPGVGNEKERILREHRVVAVNALREPEELLDYYLAIYSAMYKYGKKTIRDYNTKRVDRSYSLRAMEENGGQTLSYYSTSEVATFLDGFSNKKGIDLVDVTITKGTPCIEFMDILSDTYLHAHEHEILLPPGIRYTLEEEELTKGDLTHLDMDGNPPNRKVHITTIPKTEKAKPLTAEEKEAMAEQEKIFYDENTRELARKYLNMLRAQALDSRLNYRNIEPGLEHEYIRWKNAFHRLYEYKTREIEVEIDREFEEERENREGGEVEYSTSGHEKDEEFFISEDEFSEAAKLETMKSLKKALGGLASIFKGLKDIDDKENEGEDK